MIGRGACGRPWFPAQVARFLKDGIRLPDPGIAARGRLALRHFEDILSYHGVIRGIRHARKHLGWYVQGLPGGARFRATLFRLEHPAAVRVALAAFFDRAADQACGPSAGGQVEEAAA